MVVYPESTVVAGDVNGVDILKDEFRLLLKQRARAEPLIAKNCRLEAAKNITVSAEIERRWKLLHTYNGAENFTQILAWWFFPEDVKSA